jgi:hypothetical protein
MPQCRVLLLTFTVGMVYEIGNLFIDSVDFGGISWICRLVKKSSSNIFYMEVN